MQSTRFILAATLVIAAAPAAALRAQGGEGQPRRERSAQIEARRERLRREIETLARRRMDARRLRPAELADSAVRELDPQFERVARELVAIDAVLARPSLERQLRGGGAAPVDAAVAQGAAAEWRAQWEAQSAQALSSATAEGGAARRQPTGWVGVSFSGPTQTWYSRQQGLVMFNDGFPVVESVEPGSPAERAGLQAGDTVVAFDGHDIRRRQIALARQLRPGVRLVVRVRREGEMRDVPVTIERRPAGFVPTFALAAPSAPSALLAPPPPSRAPRAPRIKEVPMAVGTERIYSAPPPPPTPVAPPVAWLLGPSGGPPAVAGAEVAAINEGLRDVFGVRGGVLILNVSTGSPAASSGLRAGDVVVRVNGAAVTTPAGLQRAVAQCSERAAHLDVVRKKRDRQLTLRW